MLDIITDAMRNVFGRKPAKASAEAVDIAIADVVSVEPIYGLANVVEDMLRDPMVVMTMGVKLSNIKRADVTIALEADEADKKAAAIEKDISRLWLATLEKLTDLRNGVLTWGGLPFEIVEENAVVDGVPITRIKELKQLPKIADGKRATERLLDKDGKFGGIRVTIGKADFVIPPERSFWFARGATPLEPHGRSVFLGAPEAQRVVRRKIAKQFETFVSRWAVAGPVIHADAEAYDKDGRKINNHERIAAQLQNNLASGSALIFPNAPHPGQNMPGKYACDITHDTRVLDAEPMEIIRNASDADMSRAFGVHESVTMDSETGSYASQTVRMFVVLSDCDSEVSQFTTQFFECVNNFYATRNYPEGTAPALTIMPVSLVTDGFLIELVKVILAMPQWGPLLESGAIDIATILENGGVPLTRDFRERIEDAFQKMQEAKKLAAEQQMEIHAATIAGNADNEAVKKKAVGSVSALMR